MKIEGDGRQYWLVLHPDPDLERIENILGLLETVWKKFPDKGLLDLLYFTLDLDDQMGDEELIRAIERNLP